MRQAHGTPDAPVEGNYQLFRGRSDLDVAVIRIMPIRHLIRTIPQLSVKNMRH